MRLQIRKYLIVVGTMASCLTSSASNAQVSSNRQVSEADQRAPRLMPVFTSSTVPLSPTNLSSAIRVGPQGSTLFEADGNEVRRLLLLDSLGRPQARFAPAGAGPGEVRLPIPLAVEQHQLWVWDAGQQRLMSWSTAGELLTSTTGALAFAPSMMTARGVIGLQLRDGLGLPVLVQTDLKYMERLTPDSDSFWTRQTRIANLPTARYAPVLGEWSGGFLLGHPMTYEVGVYSWNGRLLRRLTREPPATRLSEQRVKASLERLRRTPVLLGGDTSRANIARMEARIRAQPVPAFSENNPLATDAQDRIWVVGISGDDAFADVYANARFIGRIQVPCKGFQGRWHLSARWLALVCLADDPAYEGDAVVRLFRIEG